MASTKTTKDTGTTVPRPVSTKPAPAAPSSPHTTIHDKEGDPVSGPTHEQIARRAYEIYTARGGTHGQDADDWRRAEEELRHGR